MDSSSFLEVPRPPYYCEECYYILFGEHPTRRISPFDQTICTKCSQPVGLAARRNGREDTTEDIDDDWVAIDAKKDTFSLDEGQADWVTIHDTGIDNLVSSSTSNDGGVAKLKGLAVPSPDAKEDDTEDESSGPAVVPLSLGLRPHDGPTRLTAPTVPRPYVNRYDIHYLAVPRPQTPGTAASDADSGEPKNENAEENVAEDRDPKIPSLGLKPPTFPWSR
ncbi:hypothetical protein M434DRAFT_11763 [Hypoxylon sp. CO27-5]|nr:hypothetical protein M434DRAFT_11763 [Hypoxylon sp. CO27-5]